MKAKDVTDIVERIAPLGLAASWDNSGWQIGSPQAALTGVLLALDLTLPVVEEASAKGLNLIVVHHPVFFRPMNRLDLDVPRGRLVAEVVRRGLQVYAAHTNLDQAAEGVSMALAKRLELADAKFLEPTTMPAYKLAVFVPPDHVEVVKQAMGEVGAGVIGAYGFCFWQTTGTGQFLPLAGASPYVGQVGEVTKVEEARVEGVVESDKLPAVLQAMLAAHPYEEVAYDLYPLANAVRHTGWGAWGRLLRPMTIAELVAHVRQCLGAPTVRVIAGAHDRHETLAVCGGAGASFLGQAARSATAYVTADVKYHEAQDAAELGLTVLDVGHYYTERPVLDELAAKIGDACPVPVIVSGILTSPFKE